MHIIAEDLKLHKFNLSRIVKIRIRAHKGSLCNLRLFSMNMSSNKSSIVILSPTVNVCDWINFKMPTNMIKTGSICSC